MDLMPRCHSDLSTTLPDVFLEMKDNLAWRLAIHLQHTTKMKIKIFLHIQLPSSLEIYWTISSKNNHVEFHYEEQKNGCDSQQGIRCGQQA